MSKLLTAGVLVLTLTVVACAGPGSARPQAAAPGSTSGAAAPLKAPGPFIANGEVDGSSGKVDTTMTDSMRYAPNVITRVKPGQSITLQARNTGATIHNVYAPSLGIAAPVRAGGGQSLTATFTAPAAPGTYQFWCNERGHAEAGMIGQIVVD